MPRRLGLIAGGLTATTMALTLGGGAAPATTEAAPAPRGCYEVADDKVNVVGQTGASKVISGLGELILRDLNLACATPTPERQVKVAESATSVTLSIGRVVNHAHIEGTPENTPLWHGASVTVNRNPDGSLNDGGITNFEVHLGPDAKPENAPGVTISGERDPSQNYCNWTVDIHSNQSMGNQSWSSFDTQQPREPREAENMTAFTTGLSNATGVIVDGAVKA